MKVKIRNNEGQIKKKSFLLFSSFFFLTSCLFFQDPAPQPKRACSAGNARFIADQITKSPNSPKPITINYKHKEGLKKGLFDSFTLNLKTCLKDSLRPDASIQNASFEILYDSNLTEEEERVQVVSDSEGCIQWEETYKYKYTLRTAWIGLKRVIRQVEGAYSGGVEIETAVNPWRSDNEEESGHPQILDMRCEYSGSSFFESGETRHQNRRYHKEGLKFLETADQEKPLLIAPDLGYQVTEISGREKLSLDETKDLTEAEIKELLIKYLSPCDSGDPEGSCYKRYFKFDFRIPIKFRSVDSISSFETPLDGGVYNLKSILIIKPKEEGETKYNLAECENEGVSLSDDKKLSFSCEFDIAFFNQNSVFDIFHRISPVNPDKPEEENYLPMRHFEGEYTIRSTDFGSGAQNDVKINTDDNNIYDKVLRDPAKNLKLLGDTVGILKAKQSNQAGSVNLKVLQLGATGDFKYSNIQPGENTIEREISFVGKICLTDALNSQKLENTKFRVFLQKPRRRACEETAINKKITGQIIEVFSNPDKKEKFETDNEKCLTIPIRVPHKVFNKQRYFEIVAHLLSEDLNLYGSVKLALNPWQRAFQAFQDAQNLDENNIRFTVDDINPPELVINQFRSINLFPSYGLDKLLNIHLFHRFYLLFQPFIRRPDNVSLGLDHKSRELLRDGYYLVRVLILRNPRETGDWPRVENQEKLNRTRSQIQVEEEIDLETADYITHTDSVVRSKANFVNFYMPVYLSTKQMYYIASRNMIVIQIYPADPNHIVDKDDGSVDREQTKWRAFTNHDLVNRPYAGAINIQNWTNWNLLQPVKIDTDKAIDLSPIGRKYKHFDFSQLNERKDPEDLDLEKCRNRSVESDGDQNAGSAFFSSENEGFIYEEPALSEGCRQAVSLVGGAVEEEYERLEAEEKRIWMDSGAEGDHALREKRRKAFKIINKLLHEDEEAAGRVRESCHEEGLNYDQEGLNYDQEDYGPALEIYKREVESKYTPELLNYFSLENALKPIELGTEQAQEFTEDLKKSYKAFFSADLDMKPSAGLSIDFSAHPLFAKYNNLFSYIPYFHRRSFLKNAYFLMLKSYSSNRDFSAALFNFIEKNKELPGWDIAAEPQITDSCREGGGLDCSGERLKLIINSNILESLIFEGSVPVDSFVKNQTLIFSLLFLLPEREALELLDESARDGLRPFDWEGNSQMRRNYTKPFLNKITERLKENESYIINRLNPALHPQSVQHKAKYRWNQIISQNPMSYLVHKDIIFDEAFNEDALKALVNGGVKNENINSFENISFFKSLCLFWFEDFIKKYLEDPKLRIATYTNYVRQFNYLQILEHSYIANKTDPKNFRSDLQSAIDEIEKSGAMGEEERRCHRGYRKCVTQDFCFANPIGTGDSSGDSKAAYCSGVSYDSSSCADWLDNICSHSDHANLSLCRDVSQSCQEGGVDDFCRLNPDRSFCGEFENRCFKNYTNCLENLEEEDKSGLFQKTADQILNNTREPMETCLKDFNEVFKVENKMFVYDLSMDDNKLNYQGGFLRHFSLSSNNSLGSYMNWTAQRGKSFSTSASFDPTKIFSNFIFGVSAALSQSQSDNESNSSRIAWDTRAGEGVYLSVGEARVEVGVKEFQKCLVIKPRPNAFMAGFQTGEPKNYTMLWSDEAADLDKIVLSRPGLILCNPVEKRSPSNLEKIKETYYYISQSNTDPSNSQFLDLYDLANRPFIAILRGKREFFKFYHLARRLGEEGPINNQPDNQFLDHADIAEYARGLSLKLREVTQTGFYPGVYDYPWNVNEELDAKHLQNKNSGDYMVHIVHPYKLFDVPSTSKGTIRLQE